jgi:hypothetical protein
MNNYVKECHILGSTFAIFNFSSLAGIVNENNILVIYLSLIVVFFLLGLLFGHNIGARKKETKRKKSAVTQNTLNNTRQPNSPIPDSRVKTDGQIYNPNQSQTHSRRKHKHRKHNSMYPL